MNPQSPKETLTLSPSLSSSVPFSRLSPASSPQGIAPGTKPCSLESRLWIVERRSLNSTRENHFVRLAAGALQ
uniref:Uncharacterized protein n=1 Tax=Salix viminalis TaxID=40686 RepID=A0A6N2MAF8_SALVM